MSDTLIRRLRSAKDGIQKRSRPSAWVLPKQKTTFADPDKWSNIDADVTPIERRTWTSWTVLGFWISDAMNAQGWEAPSSIIAVGLTWREAVYCIIFGSVIDTIPLILNGAIGADLHVPFPVAARSSFGFYLARFAVVVRLITALFWHAIQTYTGSTAITQCIRAIWPSYLDIPNHIPASVGITSQEMVSHFLFWSIQFPILLTPPHKLKWFLWFKSVIVIVVSVATVIAMTLKAGGTGDIWDQQYSVHGSKRSWLILSSVMSVAGGWATMATNVPDFTRYLKKPQGVYWQGLFLPLISIILGLFGIISTSSAKVVYGEYIWDPLSLAAQWHGPAGRCGAFFVGFACLCRYINIRRGVIVVTITAGWVMVPWKIVYSAESLLNFMAGLSIFLCPISAILATDYWLVKRKHIDVPSLYRRHARYRYDHGCNWRAAAAFIVSVVPNTPGLAKAVNASVAISAGIQHVEYDMNYLYGFVSASFVYWSLSYIFPATETLISATVHEDVAILDGVEYQNDCVHEPEMHTESGSMSEKKAPHADTKLL
ncbi:Permease for cytosine/purines, uracil, thiamine, allantoin [Teratosphaeria destructans]|uniref:Permease for cytosine/purines, uracil, thiamine, allantoin n=1 Tax=Teratosphaeria destructans TaxID=418781 RepID=A0A9W7SJE2_9PEZI|nr:Permease for cytosine/purines, uracil, thiamine, allantoin [Teratosphaeria destructans]